MELASATEKTLLEHKIRELEFQKSRIEREKQSLEGDLIASQKEVIGLKCSVSELSASSAGLRAEFETVQRNYQTEKAAKEKFNALLDTANKEIDDLKVSQIDNNILACRFCFLIIILYMNYFERNFYKSF